MAYGKIKADAIIYDDSGSDVEKTIAVLDSAASTASPTFTGDVTLTGASANVVFDASDNALEFADNAKATFGEALSIYHNGSHSYIDDLDTGELHIRSDQINFNKYTGEALARFRADGNCELFYDNSSKFQTTAAGVTVTGTATATAVEDSKGDVRSIPLNSKTSSYTLVASDAGKCILITTGGITVNNNVFSAGDAVTIINSSASDQTITQGSGFTINNSADATTGNRTLAGRGMCTLYFILANEAYISGAGLS